MTASDESALIAIGRYLREIDYSFTTVTPESHKRVLARRSRPPQAFTELQTLRDFFGWNREIEIDRLPKSILGPLITSGLAETSGNRAQSKIRFSTIDSLLLLHSGYPTNDPLSVFFGPDTYRFVRFLKSRKPNSKSLIDLGCGSGAGGFTLAVHLKQTAHPPRLTLSDSNETALRFARINAKVNAELLEGIEIDFQKSDLLNTVPPGADLVIANPPFIIDEKKRAYRDGGDHWGADLSVKMARAGLDYLPAGGRLLMYTGTCFVDGRDVFHDLMQPYLKDFKSHYDELDPDIFGEELSEASYEQVDRIAAVGLDVFKKL